MKMKRRADNFLMPCDWEAMEIIQREMQQYKEYLDDIREKAEKADNVNLYANAILGLYLRIAMDEGYRRVIEELKHDYKDTPYILENIKEKPRAYNVVEYVDEGEDKTLAPLIRRRIKSKRQRKRWAQACADSPGQNDCEENFVLMMVIHTGFEHGYLKAQSIEETAKIICKDQERADMVVELFNEIFTPEVLEKLEKNGN